MGQEASINFLHLIFYNSEQICYMVYTMVILLWRIALNIWFTGGTGLLVTMSEILVAMLTTAMLMVRTDSTIHTLRPEKKSNNGNNREWHGKELSRQVA